MSDYQTRALQTYSNLFIANGATQAFKTAALVGLFDELAGGQRTLSQLADSLQLDEAATGLLLNALTSSGVVEKYGDDYALSQAMKLFGANSLHLGDEIWSELEGLLRRGQPARTLEPAERADRAAAYRAHAVGRQWSMTPAAMETRRLLEIGERRQGLNILDLGAGSGVWSLALAYHDPTSRLTLVDLPQVLPLAVDTARQIGVEDRVSVIEGDHLTAELPDSEFDLAIAANVLHQYAEPEARRILGRLHAALKPGGELAVIDLFGGQPQGDALRDQQALHIALRTPGAIHEPSQLQQWLSEAGFVRLTYSPLKVAPFTMGLLVAERPAASD